MIYVYCYMSYRGADVWISSVEVCVNFVDLCKRKNKENMWVDQITTMQEFPRSELSFMSDVGIILTGGENDLLNATPEENDVSLIHYIFMWYYLLSFILYTLIICYPFTCNHSQRRCL